MIGPLPCCDTCERREAEYRREDVKLCRSCFVDAWFAVQWQDRDEWTAEWEDLG